MQVKRGNTVTSYGKGKIFNISKLRHQEVVGDDVEAKFDNEKDSNDFAN